MSESALQTLSKTPGLSVCLSLSLSLCLYVCLAVWTQTDRQTARQTARHVTRHTYTHTHTYTHADSLKDAQLECMHLRYRLSQRPTASRESGRTSSEAWRPRRERSSQGSPLSPAVYESSSSLAGDTTREIPGFGLDAQGSLCCCECFCVSLWMWRMFLFLFVVCM